MIPAALHFLTSTSPTVIAILSLPSKLSISKPSLSPKHQPIQQNHHQPQIQSKISRRNAAALLSLLALSHPGLATAFSIGISGPKEWLKEQKKKASKFLVAPIDASREILRSAYLLLINRESDSTSKALEDVQKMFRSAARDCVPQERNSFVTFQANTGVEVCTFKLIVKNASSLLDDNDPVKLEAEGILNDLIRSFTSLNGLANETDIQLASNRQKVVDALMDTISCLDKFEHGIKECLEV
ncbi:hypothetical protein CFOL_v3_02393 [Cephalotus follicularis]|uniref:Uncharacterized protein n=1 Tax=Cephalotus follicularis TaxID=3775 RepID=A0A1Q3AT79_CEPFO|nr:hypothetical protein CFOL_v3_02393 [Cephalotus follicularis]